MNTIETDDLELVLALVGLLVYLALLLRRQRAYRLNRWEAQHRLFLVDVLLVTAATEIALDALADTLGHGTAAGTVVVFLSLMARGMFIAGGIALLATIDVTLRGANRE